MPDWTSHLRPRLAALRLTPAREAEIVEELSQHLQERYDELLAGGVSNPDALQMAIDELLEAETLATRLRPLRQANVTPAIVPGAPRRSLGADLWQDVRYAARTIVKHRGFSAAAILTLALGIGANSAMFALADAVLLRPLPFPQPDRLVMLWESTPQSPRASISPLNMMDWERRSHSFEAIAGFVPNVGGMVLRGDDGLAETIPRQWVTAGIFDTLGIQPIAGRTFQASDDTSEANVVVLAESFWRARFGADRGIVGREIGLDGTPFTVVGVVPDSARIIGRTSIWALVSIQGAGPEARGFHSFHGLGRLRPTTTLDAARADAEAVARNLAAEFPGTNAGRGVTLEPLHDAVTGGDLRRTSMLFLGVVGFVLLISCANVANLLLVRATTRRRELAIRSAIGADRARVTRQLLTESVVLSLLGGLAGLGVGALILELAPAVLPPDLLPATVTLTIDGRVATLCAVTAVVVGLLFGLAPAWQATRLSAASAIDAGNRSVTGRGWIRSVLVAGEVALAVMLLVGAGLLLRTLLVVQNVDRGYRAGEILTMIVDPLGSQYPTEASLLNFFEDVEREVTAVPGVRQMAWASTLPLGFSYAGDYLFEVVGDAAPEDGVRPTADYQIVSPQYFDAIDLDILDGRGFTERDTGATTPVCIVNEAFVRRYLPGRSPIGRMVSVRPADAGEAAPVLRQIVGVARQVKGRPDETGDLLQIYVPLRQDLPGDIFMVVRPESGRAAALAPAVRRAIARVDTEQLVSIRSVMTLDDVAREATAPHRFRATLVMAFAGLALALAMIGLFGTIAYSVQQHARDFGVRRALGATTLDIVRLVMVGAGRVVLVGSLVGLALAAALGRLLDTLLFGVEPLDPLAYASVAGLLAFTAMLAAAGPAWRAASIDPVDALRAE
jgi:putative ABC transport system permease protein